MLQGEVNGLKVTIILEPDTTGYHIYSPNFPGCHSQGESEVEALRNFAEALEGWLKVEMEVEEKAGAVEIARAGRPSSA